MTLSRFVAVLVTAVLAVGSGAGQAAARPTSENPVPGRGNGFAAPPPFDESWPLPADTGQPDRVYAKKADCVTSLEQDATLEDRPWGQDVLRFRELPRLATGAGQTVAVIDTGVAEHTFLKGRLAPGPDYVNDGADGGSLNDCDGHGTEVAGIIAADPGTDDIGFRGIAPAARILSIRQSSGAFSYDDPNDDIAAQDAGNLRTLAMAIVHAADANVDVINMSVDSCRSVAGGQITPDEQAVYAAVRYAVERKDVVLVASAGNRGNGTCKTQNSADPLNPTLVVVPPWFSEHVISVAAMDRDGRVADFSIQGPWVGVAAPGTEIISLDPANPTQLANLTFDEPDKRSSIRGTSFAAPYVAGLAALVREKFPWLTAKQVMHRIKVTASHPAGTGGRDNLVGHGMINPVAALTHHLPIEHGAEPNRTIAMPFELPPPHERDWAPAQVAMISAGAGVGLLLLILFVVHTVRRNHGPAKPHRRS